MPHRPSGFVLFSAIGLTSVLSSLARLVRRGKRSDTDTSVPTTMGLLFELTLMTGIGVLLAAAAHVLVLRIFHVNLLACFEYGPLIAWGPSILGLLFGLPLTIRVLRREKAYAGQILAHAILAICAVVFLHYVAYALLISELPSRPFHYLATFSAYLDYWVHYPDGDLLLVYWPIGTGREVGGWGTFLYGDILQFIAFSTAAPLLVVDFVDDQEARKSVFYKPARAVFWLGFIAGLPLGFSVALGILACLLLIGPVLGMFFTCKVLPWVFGYDLDGSFPLVVIHCLVGFAGGGWCAASLYNYIRHGTISDSPPKSDS